MHYYAVLSAMLACLYFVRKFIKSINFSLPCSSWWMVGGVAVVRTGALKMTDMKMTDHQNCKAWNCRTWKCRTWKCKTWNCKTWQELVAFCLMLVFFLYCDVDVAAMELCNVVWNELKKDPMIHVTSLRVELSEQVTTQTILICNINNETIKICSSCIQFSTVQCIQIREHCYIYDEQVQLSFFVMLWRISYWLASLHATSF